VALNLTKTFTVKSNAHADVRKAIKRGECAEGDYTVVALSGGFRIVPAIVQKPTSGSSATGFEPVDEDADAEARPVAEEATSPAGWRAPEPLGRWPEASVPGLGRFNGDAHAADAAAIIAPDAAAMAEALAADRDAAAAEVEAELEEARRELLTDPQVRIGPAVLADWEAERAAVARDVTPGLARLRADEGAEAIRAAVVADQERALAEASVVVTARKAKVERAKQDRATKARKVERAIAKLDPPKAATAAKAAVQRAVERAIANGSPVIVEQPAAPKAAGLSPGAALILRALLDVAGAAGVWVDQKAIPHNLGRAAPGYLSGLQKRGLAELRADKGGKFSARATLAGWEAVR
jgi:hypothetical protein